jgi:mRNA interferase MazF
MKGFTTMLRAGEIWLANIPFTTGTGRKLRPVLILWMDAQDAVVAAITSASPRSATDIPLQDWPTEGLRVPSTLRLSRLDSLEQSVFVQALGCLSSADSATVRKVWNTQIRLAF